MAFNKRTWNDRFGKEFSNQDSMRRLDAGRVRMSWLVEVPSYIDSVLITNTSTNTNETLVSAIKNTSLKEYITQGDRNLGGALISIHAYVSVSGAKTQMGTKGDVVARYSRHYNTIPETYNYMLFCEAQHTASDADNATLFHEIGYSASPPIVYEGNEPFLVWELRASFQQMTAVNAVYNAAAYIYLLGFYK